MNTKSTVRFLRVSFVCAFIFFMAGCFNDDNVESDNQDDVTIPSCGDVISKEELEDIIGMESTWNEVGFPACDFTAGGGTGGVQVFGNGPESYQEILDGISSGAGEGLTITNTIGTKSFEFEGFLTGGTMTTYEVGFLDSSSRYAVLVYLNEPLGSLAVARQIAVAININLKNDDGSNNSDVYGTVPPIASVEIFIEWNTNFESSGEEYHEYEGKANISLQLKSTDDDVEDVHYFPLAGIGAGEQFDCNVDIYSAYHIDNLSAPTFTVAVTSGSFTYGKYAFKIASENAYFGYDIYRTEDNSFFSHDDPDALIYVLNDIIFELSSSTGSAEIILGETISGIEYAASARFVKP